MAFSRLLIVTLALPIVLSVTGCFSSQESEQEEFLLGDLLDEFEPPTLAELDASANWESRPVIDTVDRLNSYFARQPHISFEEARSIKNDSDEANEKIHQGFSKAPPSDDAVDWDAEFVRHARVDMANFNPLMTSSVVEGNILALTAAGWITFDWELNQLADADTVAEWYTSEDRMVDKIVLRDDITWSDGKPFTAHDIEYSFKVINSSQVPIPAVRTGTEDINYVKAYDDQTIVFFHKESLATNVGNMNFPAIPKHIYEESIPEDPKLVNSPYHVNLEKNPVVSGPYEVESRKIGSEIVLRRRKAWYERDGEQVRKKPHFEKVIFRVITEPAVALSALKAGDVHDKELVPEEWATKTNGEDFYKRATKVRDSQWVTFFFTWNLKLPYFEDKRVRQALAYAFDYDELLNTLNFGLEEQSSGTYHPDSPWYPQQAPPLYTRDLDKARELLDAAGWKDTDGDGLRDKEVNGRKVPFEFTVMVPTLPDRVAICKLLQESLIDVNIKVNIQSVDFVILQEKTRKHEYQAAFGGWSTGAVPDVSVNIWGTDQGRNFGHYSNERVDELFKQARTELDEEKRREIFGEIHNVLFEDQPYMWLFYLSAKYGYNKEMAGWKFSPRGPYNFSPGFSSIWKSLK